MRPGPVNVLSLLVFVSGAAALTYESLWMRAFGLIFGITTHAVTVTLVTFLGGLALGSALVSRVRIRRPLLAIAVVEAGIGLSALLTMPLLRGLPGWYGALLGGSAIAAHWQALLRFAAAGAVVLVPTLLLGATFPIFVEAQSRLTRDFRKSLGSLYKLNTLGGAIGVVLGGFVLIPRFGVSGTFLVAALMNLSVALAAFLLGRRGVDEEPRGAAERPAPRAPRVKLARAADSAPLETAPPAGSLPAMFVLTAAATGACSFGLEILWTRSLSLVIGSSIYSFNLMLVAFLIGIVLGTSVYERTRDRLEDAGERLAVTLGAAGLLAVAQVWIVGWLPLLYFNVMRIIPAGFLAYEAAGFALCLLVMLPITIAFGYTFPLLAHLVAMERRAPQEVSGLLFAWNTLGSISGALLTSVLLIPAFGLQSSYVAMAALPLLAALLVLSGARGWGRTARLAAAAALALALVLLGGAWRPWDLRLMTAGIYRNGVDWVRTAPPGFFWLRDALRASRDIVFYDEGREAVVSVARTGGDNSILVNGKADGGTSRWDSATQKLLAHVPLIIHPDPRKALVIGWGTGGTAGSAALHPLRDLHVVEIEPAVFRAAEFFEGVNLGVARDPRQRVTFEDARTVLLTSPETYDVIISEPSNPWISGVSNLFTEEFYRIALPRLLTDGIFCQWFHYYGMTVEDIRAQVRTFTAVFPHASLWIAPPITPEGGPSTVSGDLLLLGSRSPMVLDAGRVRARIADPAVAANLAGVGVQEAIDLLLDQVMDEEDLRAFAGEGRHNTDDDPLIEFSAPRGLFLGPEERTRILGLLESGGRAVVPRILHEPGLDAGASAGERAAAYVRLAGVMRRKEMLERSARLLRTALALDGNVAAAHASLGEIRYVQGRREEAEQALGRALEQDPGLKQPYMLLGFLYFERRNLSEARRMFDGLTDRFPDEAAGYYGQALVDAEGKDWARSKERLKTALSIQPGFEQARRLLEFVDGQSR